MDEELHELLQKISEALPYHMFNVELLEIDRRLKFFDKTLMEIPTLKQAFDKQD